MPDMYGLQSVLGSAGARPISGTMAITRSLPVETIVVRPLLLGLHAPFRMAHFVCMSA